VSRLVAAVIFVIAGWLGVAWADPETDADRAFRAASQRAAAGDPAAIDAFEALGSARPITRWTDDAWAEVARHAERRGDFARARRALEQVIAIGTDDKLVQRARGTLARLAASTGGGQWDALAREHDRLVAEVFAGGDPHQPLEMLEQLVRANPRYPRATSIWLVLAQGWEREGDAGRAVELLRDALASGADRPRIGLALARALIRRGELDDAAAQLDALAAAPGADHRVIADVRAKLDVASRRAWIRKLVWLGLGVIAVLAAIALRRDAGSWRAAARRLARPPIEAVFLIPIGAVLVAVAQTGNPLVAKALLAIVLAGIAVAWLSGALLEARAKHGGIAARRAVGQALLAVAVMAGAAYLAVDRDRMLDLVGETWEHGPVAR
jgi:tetratricopeptide (TPR) repeat protein